MQVQLSEERRAQLDAYAERHGQDAAAALDELLDLALEQDKQDFQETVEGIRQGLDDIKAGRTRPASEFLQELGEKYGFSR